MSNISKKGTSDFFRQEIKFFALTWVVVFGKVGWNVES
jgi:hypothetical protein